MSSVPSSLSSHEHVARRRRRHSMGAVLDMVEHTIRGGTSSSSNNNNNTAAAMPTMMMRAKSLLRSTALHDSAASGNTVCMDESNSLHHDRHEDQACDLVVRKIRAEHVPHHRLGHPESHPEEEEEEDGSIDDSIQDSAETKCRFVTAAATKKDTVEKDTVDGDGSLNFLDAFATPTTSHHTTNHHHDDDDDDEGDDTIFDSIDGDDDFDHIHTQTRSLVALHRQAWHDDKERQLQQQVLQDLRASVGVLAPLFPGDLDDDDDDGEDSSSTYGDSNKTRVTVSSSLALPAEHDGKDVPREIAIWEQQPGGYVAFVSEGEPMSSWYNQECDYYCWEALA